MCYLYNWHPQLIPYSKCSICNVFLKGTLQWRVSISLYSVSQSVNNSSKRATLLFSLDLETTHLWIPKQTGGCNTTQAGAWPILGAPHQRLQRQAVKCRGCLLCGRRMAYRITRLRTSVTLMNCFFFFFCGIFVALQWKKRRKVWTCCGERLCFYGEHTCKYTTVWMYDQHAASMGLREWCEDVIWTNTVQGWVQPVVVCPLQRRSTCTCFQGF